MAYEGQETRACDTDLGARFDQDLVNYLRSDMGKTLKEIGELAGLSESQISRVANGISRLPREPLGTLLRNLNVPLKYLLFVIDEKYNRTLPIEERELDEDIKRVLEKSERLGSFLRKRKRR